MFYSFLYGEKDLPSSQVNQQASMEKLSGPFREAGTHLQSISSRREALATRRAVTDVLESTEQRMKDHPHALEETLNRAFYRLP